MRTEIHFKDMDRSEALESFALDKVEPLCSYLHRSDCHIMVWLISVNSRFATGTPEYKCEIEVRYPPKHDVFVSKTSEDMYEAINQATHAMQVMLRNRAKREINTRNDEARQL